MRTLALAALALAAMPGLRAQILVDEKSEAGARLKASFEQYLQDPEAGSLACEVTHFAPSLDYGLMLWSGYNASIRADQFEGRKERGAGIFFRVLPEAKPERARFFAFRFDVPQLPKEAVAKKMDFRAGGGFLLGPGRYKVDWMMVDAEGRRCKASWRLAASGKGASKVVEADSVAGVDRGFWSGFGGEGKRGHALVFVHVAPVFPRRHIARLSAWDRQILLSSLSSLFREGGYTSASVVAFDLERRQVLYRETKFDRRGLRRLARTLETADLGTISMDTLANAAPPGEFLGGLLREELKKTDAPEPSSVVYIGTTWRAGPPVPPAPADLREAVPPVFFLALRMPTMPDFGDSVSSLVKSLNGKVLSVTRPTELASGIKTLSGVMSRREAGGTGR